MARRRHTYRFVDGPSRTWSSSAQSHYERSDHHPTGLVKQAYSAWVQDTVSPKPRKWHLTAYFTYADLQSIPTTDRDPVLRTVSVPTGVYKSGKARSRTSEAADTHSHPSSSRPSSPAPRQSSSTVILPSLHSTITNTQLNHPVAQHRGHGPRLAEDQRMIQMLNSRPIL